MVYCSFLIWIKRRDEDEGGGKDGRIIMEVQSNPLPTLSLSLLLPCRLN